MTLEAMELLVLLADPDVAAGMRGGVSFALALSMPVGTEAQIALRDGFILAIFIIVVMSVLVQGLTMEPIARAPTTRIK